MIWGVTTGEKEVHRFLGQRYTVLAGSTEIWSVLEAALEKLIGDRLQGFKQAFFC